MEPGMTCQDVRVAIGNRNEPGLLVFAKGSLVAVVTQVGRTMGGAHRRVWFLEAGFGPCAAWPKPEFDSSDEVQAWIAQRIEAASLPY